MQERARLSRDREHRMVGGVCAGIASHYDYDPTVVRVVFVVLSLLSGFGILVYVAMWLLLPPGDSAEAAPGETIRGNADDIASRARQAAEAARQAGDQLSDATRAGVAAARETWQQRAATASGATSEAAASDTTEAPTAESSDAPWPPDRPLPATEASPDETEPRRDSSEA